MKTFLLILLGLNAAYFAFVAYLSYRAVKRNDPERGRYHVRLGGWIDFTTGFVLPAFNLNLGSYFDNRVSLQLYWIYGSLFLKLPIKTKYDECFPPSYGVSLTDIDSDGWQQVHWHWRRKTVIWNMPWTLDWVRTSRLLNDVSWENETKGNRVDNWSFPERYWRRTYPYRYTLKNGQVQERTAEVRVTVREWRPRWAKWTRLFAKVRQSIEIDFSDEVGERSGSWKGGTTGCSWAMQGGESPYAALRRMEAERLFN